MNKKHLRSIRIAERVFSELKEFVKPDVSEKEVATEIRKRVKKYGAKKESFRVIVASGKNSAKIHGFSSRKKIKPKDVIMFDFGALYQGWRSDITRSYVVGKPTQKQKKIYALLKKAQAAGIKRVKAGVKCSKIDDAVRSVIDRAGFGDYFVHSTGHGVGKKTHEAPRISANNDNILKTGQIITIEPGIYFKKKWGMRVEDMILVTKNGAKVLTNLPRKLQMTKSK